MSDNLLDGVMDDCDMLGAPRPGEGMYETATGGLCMMMMMMKLKL